PRALPGLVRGKEPALVEGLDSQPVVLLGRQRVVVLHLQGVPGVVRKGPPQLVPGPFRLGGSARVAGAIRLRGGGSPYLGHAGQMVAGSAPPGTSRVPVAFQLATTGTPGPMPNCRTASSVTSATMTGALATVTRTRLP